MGVQLMVRVRRLDLTGDELLNSLVNLRHQLLLSASSTLIRGSTTAHINRVQFLLLGSFSLESPTLASFDHIPSLHRQ